MRLQFTNRRAVNIRRLLIPMFPGPRMLMNRNLCHGSDKGENLCLHGRTGRLNFHEMAAK